MLMSFENKVGKIREIYIPRLTKKGGKEIDTPRCFHCGWLITRAEPRLLVVVTTTTCFTNRVKKSLRRYKKKHIHNTHLKMYAQSVGQTGKFCSHQCSISFSHEFDL